MIGLGLVGSRLAVSYRSPFTGCARDRGTGGALGIVRWAGRLKIPTELLEAPLVEALDTLQASRGNCVITAGDGPLTAPAASESASAWPRIRAWVARGNTLVVETTSLFALPEDARAELAPVDAAFAPSADASSFLVGENELRVVPSTAPLASGESMRVNAAGPRLVPRPPEVGPPQPGVTLKSCQLAGDERGGVLFVYRIGAGSVYLLLDSYAWTNSGFDQGDNARLLADITQRAIHDGGVLAFDEDSHGHGRAQSFLTFLAQLPGASSFAWLATVWLVLYAIGQNVRLKPAEPFHEKERRTAREYLDAVAQLYDRARAAPLVVEAAARRLRQLERATVEPPVAVREVLQKADALVAAGERPRIPRAAIHLVKQLIQTRKQYYGSRTIS